MQSSPFYLYFEFMRVFKGSCRKEIAFVPQYMMKEHDMAIVITSGFYSKPLLLAISANPVKVFIISVLHEVEQVVVFIAASLNIELLFVDRRGFGARTRSIVSATK